jgi:hypothetical protein
MAKRKLTAVPEAGRWDASKIDIDDIANANADLWQLNQLCVWSPPGESAAGKAFAHAVSSLAIRVGMHLDKALHSAGVEGEKWADQI